MKNEKGFSLVELLVVVIIIAIIAAIAIPNLLSSRRAANEASAISSLRSIHSAEATYQATLGANVTYGSLADLGAAPSGLIDPILAAGTKSGYAFADTRSVANDAYCVTATPTGATTGLRIFAVSTPGVIWQSAPNGATPPSCAAGVIATPAGSTPIQ